MGSNAVTSTFTFSGTNTGGGSGVLGVRLAASGDFNIVNSGATLAITAIVSETGGARSINKTGLGTLVLNGVNTFSGGLTISAGTVNINNAAGVGASTNTTTIAGGARLRITANSAVSMGSSRLFNLSGGDAVIDVSDPLGQVTIGGIVSGSGRLTKEGSGVLVLTGDNTHGGGIWIKAGTLSASDALDLGPSATDVNTIEDLARFRWTGSGSTILSSARKFVLTSGSGIIDVASSFLEIGGEISGAGRLVKDGTGRLNLSNANIMTGGVSVLAGILSADGFNRLGPLPGSYTADYMFVNGGTLRMDFSTTLGSNRGLTLGSLGGIIEIADTRTVTLLAPTVGTGSLSKTGNGTLILGNATNTYSGPTSVSAGVLQILVSTTVNSTTIVNVADSGTLQVNGTLDSSGGVTIGSGGTLSGTGTVQDSLVVNSGGVVSPGNSVGKLTVSGTTNQWNAGSTVYFEFKDPTGNKDTAAGTNWDLLDLTGSALTLAGTINLRIDAWKSDNSGHATFADPGGNSFNPSSNYQWLFVKTGGISGFTPSTFVIADSTVDFGVFGTPSNAFTNALGGSFWVSQSGNDLYINYASVPEPGSLVFVGLATLGCYSMRRRKLRRSNVANTTPPFVLSNA